MQIEVRLGDIADQPDIDAIVCPSSDQLIMTGRIGGAIRAKAGVQIDLDAQRKGPIHVGEAVSTGPGGLPNLYVIHTAIIGTESYALPVKTEHGSLTSGPIVGSAVLHALMECEHLGLRSVAFPAMGVELARFPIEQSANVMLDQISAYATDKPNSSVQRVVIVCANEEQFHAFDRRVIQRMAS